MYTFLVVIQVVAALAVIGLVLIQHGKGADAGAAFGSGASGTVFGARGSANFLTRATAACATVFFVVSLSLAYMVQGRKAPDSVVDTVAPKSEAPVAVPDEESPPAEAAPKTPEVPE
jgi:preprotein translocase subunit SecG